MVAVKTFVFSIDEGLDDNGRDILVLDRRTVFAEKTVYLGSFAGDRMFNVFESG